MGESLTMRRRVSDEGPRVVKLCRVGRNGVELIALSLDVTTEGNLG